MIVVLTNIPTPYRIPLFNKVSELLEESGEKLHVLFQMPTYHRRKWTNVLDEAIFEYTILNLPRLELGHETVIPFPFGIRSALKRLSPSVLIVGGFNLSSIYAFLIARFHKIPFYIWSGETSHTFSKQKFNLLKGIIRKSIARKVTGFVAYSSEAKSYLESLRYPSEKIKICLNCVDTDFFMREVEAEKKHLRKKNSDESTVHLMYVGNLLSYKGVQHILYALHDIGLKDVTLDIVGDGPARTELENLVSILGLSKISFHGFQQKSSLPKYYAQADVFVFPTQRDVFGLVLVEAAAAGLPIIGSCFAGGSRDVIQEGVNGFVIDPRDTKLLAERMQYLILRSDERKKMGQHSIQLVKEKLNLLESARDFYSAIRVE